MFNGKLVSPAKEVEDVALEDLEDIEDLEEIKKYNLSPLHKEILKLLKGKRKGLTVFSLGLASKITTHDSRIRLALEDLVSFGLVKGCGGGYKLFNEGRH